MANRLADATSPYLLQHKDNPVDWRPWGPEALAEAQRTGKPILLSIGYAACHWCHVMAHESFEDAATAAVVNDLFVPVKVDREERPDIDHIYMSALHALGEQGGWPLTMFLKPDGTPVWGGTYFPKVSRFGRPSFIQVCREMARVFADEPAKVDEAGESLRAAIGRTRVASGEVDLGRAELDMVAGRVAGIFDPDLGGIRGAPKFPNPPALELLWRGGLRTGDGALFAPVLTTLRRMSEGGIWDHLGGGFARYSVDEAWHVPHFEKMLYDNAQLLALLALAHVHTGEPLLRARAEELVGWLTREMVTDGGAFCASLDADSEGEEGRFYVWSRAELLDVLGPADGAFLADAYSATAAGNWEHTNILHRLDRPPLSAADEARLAPLRARLLAHRDQRPRPGLDDKVLADWNGLMIAALADAGALLGVPGWIALAETAFAAVVERLGRDHRLGHCWRAGRMVRPGLSADYAMMIKAALALAEATGTQSYVTQAVAWQSALDRHHAMPTGGYYLTADDAEALLLRPAPSEDDATPNPQGVIAQNLLRLAVLTGDEAWRIRADTLMQATLPRMAANLFGHASFLNALDLRLGAAEIVCVGAGAEAFAAAARRLPFLNRIVLTAPSIADLPAGHPVRLAGGDITSAAFVCVGERCSLPVTDPARLAEAVAAMRR